MAAELLALNTKGQRTISRDAVERYAVDMSTLDWVFNGAAILISNTNELLDGQHRLSAIIESGENQVVLIVRGIDPVAMATIDAGRKRSYADSLKIRGLRQPPPSRPSTPASGTGSTATTAPEASPASATRSTCRPRRPTPRRTSG